MHIQLILIMACVMAAGIFIIISGSKSKRDQKVASQRFYKKAYDILAASFLTQGQLLKISAKLSALSIYSISEIRELATKYMLLTSVISIGLVVAAFVLFKDFIAILICITFAVVINNIMVNKQIDKANIKVYKALKNTLSSVRQEYLKFGSVTDALAEADVDPILNKSFGEIYSILTGIDSELNLLKFYESSPFRPLQTFAGVCFNIHNYGDETDEYGQSNFIQALTMLTSDINSEIQRLTTMKAKFGKIEYLPLVPIIVGPILENYFMKIMPGTALMYHGLIGYFGRAITLISCIFCYIVVANINSSTPIKEDDRSNFIKKLLTKEKFAAIAHNIIPKNQRAKKADKKLKDALSRKSLDYVYAEKIVCSAITFIVCLIIAASSITLSRSFILTSTQQLSLIPSSEMEKYSKDQILNLDNSYLHRDHEWKDSEFKSNIQASMPGLSDLQITDQIKRLKDKQSSLNTSYFHWYYMLICIVITCGAWFGPDLVITIRKRMIQTEEEDDFLQLQALMAILMNTGIDTLDALWQMCQHSRIHRNMLLYCYHSYPSNPEKELTRLQSKTPLIEFKRFIGKLKLTISDLSLRDALSDLRVDRDYMIRLREINIYSTINKKRSLCSPISLAPIALCVLNELMIPLGYLGYQQLMSALSSIQIK